jgi:translation elongation factor EF-1alpha
VAIDAPGHADYVPSMLLGAMQAEAAVLVIDCVKFDSGFSRGGQTKEHVSLIRSLGIHQLIVVLNKIDMIDPEDRYDEIESIKSQLKDFIFDEMRFTECDFIPVSAIKGENIFSPIHAEDESSICLKDALVALKPKSHGPVNHSVCIPIVDVSGDRLSGRIECGSVHDKEKLMIYPSKQMVQLHTQTRVPGSYLESVQFSFMDSSLNAGASSPTNAGTSAYIHPGSVIVDPLFPLDHIECVEKFQARILVINDDFMPIVKGQTVTVNVHTCMTDASISRLIGKINKQGKMEPGPPPKCLVKGEVAMVEISLRKGHVIAVEPNASTRVTGRVVIRDRGVTIAAGLVTKQEQS